MNKRRIRIVLMLVAVFSTALIACVPEDGDTGPVGPIGPEGPPGADGVIGRDGQNGQNGQDGIDGGSQVVAYTYTIRETDWSGTQIKADTIAVPALTDEILSKGGVQTFLTFDASVNNAVWRAIPYRSLVLVGQNTVATLNITASFEAGNVYLTNFYDDLQDRTFQDIILKVVLIPSILRKKGVEYDEISLEQLEMLHQIQDYDELGLPME